MRDDTNTTDTETEDIFDEAFRSAGITRVEVRDMLLGADDPETIYLGTLALAGHIMDVWAVEHCAQLIRAADSERVEKIRRRLGYLRSAATGAMQSARSSS